MSRKSERITTMKRAVLVCLMVTGCSAGSTTNPDLTPLPTTGIQTISDTLAPLSTDETLGSVKAYLDEIRTLTPEQSAKSDEELVRLGAMWCEQMDAGATRTEILKFAEDETSNDEDLFVWIVSAQKASSLMCPEHEYRWNP